LIFIKAYKDEHFKFIKKSLQEEGLDNKEIDISDNKRIFWIMLEKENIIGFVGVRYDILPIVLEYFWIAKYKRGKIELVYVKLIRFLKQTFKDSKIDTFIIDVKTNDKFAYLYNFVKKITKKEAYKTIGNSSFFFVPLENITI